MQPEGHPQRQGLRAWLDTLWVWGSFPTVLIGSVTAVWALRRSGVREADAVLLVSVLVATFLMGAQLLSRQRRPTLNVVGTDLLHMLLSNGLVHGIMRATAFVGVLAIARALDGSGLGMWPDHWPLPLQVLLAMLAGELFFYMAHRAMHELPRLWPLHAVHHSSTRLYVLSGARTHPLNAVLSYATQFFPAVLLGAQGDVLVYLSIFTTTVGMLQHCDLRMRTGWLGWVLATPEIHRIHHSTQLPEGNTNYGSNLLIWDHLFGTFTAPDHRPEHVGIADVDVPEGFIGHIRAPFRWRKIDPSRWTS